MRTIANDLRNIATTIITNRVDGHNLRPLNPIGFFRVRFIAIFIVASALLPALMPISISAQTDSAELAEMLQRTARTVSPAIMAIGHIEKTSAKQQKIDRWTMGVAISDDTVICSAHLLPRGNDCEYVLAETIHKNTIDNQDVTNRPRLQLIAIEYDYDIAVFKTTGNKYPFILIAPTKKLATAEIVIGFGNRSNSFTRDKLDIRLGIVSDSERYLLHKGHLAPWLVTDATIGLGSRGTIIVNLKGQLVGLAGHAMPAQALLGKMGYARSCEAVFHNVLARLRKGTPVQPAALGLNVRMTNEGLQVTEVTPAGSAETAGIEIGDILRRFAGIELTDVTTLQRQLFGLHAGDSVAVQWTRAGEPVEKQVALGARVHSFKQADFFIHEPVVKN